MLACEIIHNGEKQILSIPATSVRLDECVTQALHISKNQAQELIKSGLVACVSRQQASKDSFASDSVSAFDNTTFISCKKCGTKITHDSIIYIRTPSALDSTPSVDCSEIESKEIDILYEDAHMLVLNKPPHLVVHSAPSVREATLVDWLQAKGFMLSHLSGVMRAGIVHRLDKQTSGAIAIAKTNAMHAYLSKELKTRRMGRYYIALIDKPLKEPRVITCHLARHPNNRLKMTNIDSLNRHSSGARFSQSTFIPLINTQSTSLIAIKLHTGRTHQIRAHLESINRHILGDTLYGYKGKEYGRVMLHAYLLYCTLPSQAKLHTALLDVESNQIESSKREFMRVESSYTDCSLLDSGDCIDSSRDGALERVFCAPVFADMLQCAQQIFGKKEWDYAIQQEHILHAFAKCDSAAH